MGDWSHLIVSFRWPHQALVIGYELWDATEKQPFVTLKIHLVFISIVFEFGYGDYPDE
jgi:hypothetical protein